MIINCDNCNKNFDVDASLIPKKGRLLQCIACEYKWFFKKEYIEKSVPIVEIEALPETTIPFKEDATRVETETPKTIELLDKVTKDAPIIEKIFIKDKDNVKKKDVKIKKYKNKKNYNILSLIIVFIISFIAIIIALDTFQKPISIIIPNIESILYNLYETISDIVLFFNDLI